MSKNDFILEASPRTDVGKGASRRLRRIDGNIPAIIYGGCAKSQLLSLSRIKIL